MSIKEIISDALFDCYRGYDAETIARIKMQSNYERDAQTERVLRELSKAGYVIIKDRATSPIAHGTETSVVEASKPALQATEVKR